MTEALLTWPEHLVSSLWRYGNLLKNKVIKALVLIPRGMEFFRAERLPLRHFHKQINLLFLPECTQGSHTARFWISVAVNASLWKVREGSTKESYLRICPHQEAHDRPEVSHGGEMYQTYARRPV